mgnify:CR=1 FL=1
MILQHYIKIAFRNLAKYKVQSANQYCRFGNRADLFYIRMELVQV